MLIPLLFNRFEIFFLFLIVTFHIVTFVQSSFYNFLFFSLVKEG